VGRKNKTPSTGLHSYVKKEKGKRWKGKKEECFKLGNSDSGMLDPSMTTPRTRKEIT